MNVSHPTRFYPHGNYTIDVKGNLINIMASGAWNLEAKKDITSEIISIVQERTLTKWYISADITQFELGTPEFQQEGLICKLRLIELGLKKVAYINKDSSKAKLRQIAQMQPKVRDYRWRLFKCSITAKIWLRGYRIF